MPPFPALLRGCYGFHQRGTKIAALDVGAIAPIAGGIERLPSMLAPGSLSQGLRGSRCEPRSLRRRQAIVANPVGGDWGTCVGIFLNRAGTAGRYRRTPRR